METFRQLAEGALADKRLRLAVRSWQTDKQRAAEVIFEFGKTPPVQVTAALIEPFLDRVKARASGPTANRYRSLISSIFSFAIRRGVVAANPVAAVPRFREHESRIRFLDPTEESALRPELGHHEDEFDLALHTGIRRGEQYALRWEDVSLERGILMVSGKTGRRFVPINRAARSAIERLHPASAGSPLVCPGTRRDWFEKAVERSGIDDFHWHDIRHTFASRLVMDGVDLRSVGELLGHRSIVTTQRYAHVSLDHMRAAVEKLDRKLHPQLALFAANRNGL